MVVFFDGLEHERGDSMICNECETVAHCTKHGCVPKQPAPVQGPDWKAEYLKSVESGCITLDELRETLAELDATNRQVEILSDELAESRREVAALAAQPAGQETMAWRFTGVAGFKRYVTDAQYEAFSPEVQSWYEPFKCSSCTAPSEAQPAPEQYTALEQALTRLQKRYGELEAKVAAQPAAFVCSTRLCHYKALPDAIHHTDLSEHPEYISGWNDYRAAMMEMMK
jgi:hypothetical protein